MDKNLALEALKKIQTICPTSFLLFGSLLGCVRDNGYIPWDRDMDFGIMFEDWKEEYAQQFKKEGFVTLVDVFWIHPDSKKYVGDDVLDKRSKLQIYYREKPIRICFEVFAKGVNNHRYSGFGGPRRIFHCPDELLSETIKYPFYDTSVNIPKRYDEFLTFIYGKNWRIPNKSYIGSNEYRIREKEWKIFLD